MKKITNKKSSGFLSEAKRILRNGTWAFFIAMGIQSFFFKIPYAICLGIMFIMISFLFFPWLNVILKHFDITLTKLQRWFIGIGIFFTMAYSIKETETNYFRCLLTFGIMLAFWIGTLVYSKYKSKK